MATSAGEKIALSLAELSCSGKRIASALPFLPEPRYGADVLTVPNLLTLSRIFAVPILVFLLWKPSPIDYAITFVLYCLVGITDYFDGYLARAQGTVSRLGQFLDPIADKIMVAAVIIMLVASRRASGEPVIHDWAIVPALVILLREIIVSGLREFLAGLQVSVPVSRLAKWKTTLQLVSLGALILGGAVPDWEWVHQVGLASLWAAALLTLVTGWDYLRVGMQHMD
jgi:CDP-diacylglycerol--glycerol-3-phosphate 3-phosphatidyltransferase